MICAEEKNELLDEFSQHIRRHFPDSVWRSLFLERTGKAQFGSAERTVLCVELPEDGPLRSEGVHAMLRRLSQLHRGCIDPCSDELAFVSFGQADQALRMALAMQRVAGRARLRMGIVQGRCKVARCEADGREMLILLGKERTRASELARRAAAGTIQMCPDAWDAVGGDVSDRFGSCLVMAEFDGDALSEITVTVPPDASADLSTFAGLGLT